MKPGGGTAVLSLTTERAALLVADGSLRAGGRKSLSGPRSPTGRYCAADGPCGFPSPADDDLDRPLDFNDLLIENPAATFAVRIAGESMMGAGLFPGDARSASLQGIANLPSRCKPSG